MGGGIIQTLGYDLFHVLTLMAAWVAAGAHVLTLMAAWVAAGAHVLAFRWPSAAGDGWVQYLSSAVTC